MGALTVVAVALLATDPVAQWQPLIAEASARCGVPQVWIAGVMRAESGGRTVLGDRPIRSSKGAIGLMQLMPRTWIEMRADLGLGDDPDEPRDNIVAGACYLRRMHDRFGYPGLFAAYNAGPARYAAFLSGRGRLPGETVRYLASVTDAPREVVAPALPPESHTLFAIRNPSSRVVDRAVPLPPRSTLFIALTGEK
jgi:soluble lytic murein transglycosylase-like protein